MKTTETFVGISEALGPSLKKLGLGHLLLEERLKEKWQEFLGPRAGQLTELETMKDGKLRIRVKNSVWRNELHFQRDLLLKKANRILGPGSVKEVIFL